MSLAVSSVPGIETIQNMVQEGDCAQALQLLHRHYLPSDDPLIRIVYADALRLAGQLDASLAVYTRVAEEGGKHSFPLWRRIAETLFNTGDIDKAINAARKALSLDPRALDMHQLAAQLLFSSTLHYQAICHARHILAESESDDMLAVAENVYRFSMQPYEAYQVVKKRQACAANPDQYLGLVLCGGQGILEWDTVRRCAEILDTRYYAKGDFDSSREIPLYNLARIADEYINYHVAKSATRHLESIDAAFNLSGRLKKFPGEKIRIGLLSADFSSHPVIQLIIGLFESMDKTRFELFAFDDGKNDPNGETRMIAAMDRHIDVREQSDLVVAQKVFAEGIDILIDLMGLTTKNRQGVLALRPCPVTAVFLGFPGTCGLSKIDYVITDPVITPDSSKPFYAEKLCRLPEVFMPNDAKRLIAANPVTRAELGLPEDAVVFCSFNRSFKLDEDSVNLWMRILARVPNSVLWQKADEDHMKRAFVECAARHGVSADRIIFAGNTSSVALHMARAALADLGLDTLIYNGHTITSDMLWAGVPVITRRGTHFASRVSASLLHAVGLDDCVAESIQEMEDLAVALATNPARRTELRARLDRNKKCMPLYDTERYTRHFEQAMIMMLDRAQQGLAPDHIDVPALPARWREEDPVHAFLPDGPPRVQEDMAGTPEGGAYADMAANHALQRTPYGIHFGVCPLCGERAATIGIPVSIQQYPGWKPPLPEKTFWLLCPHCGHLHSNAFWDNEAREILEQAFVVPPLDPAVFARSRADSAAVVEYIWREMGGPAFSAQNPPYWLVVDPHDGVFPLALGCFGFQSTALTMHAGLQDYLQSLQFSIWGGDFGQTDIDGECHVITLAGLEETPWPRLQLAHARTMLKPGSFLHVPMVEFNSLAWRLEGVNEHNRYLQNPCRLHMFTRHNLVRLMEEEGFRFINLFTDASQAAGMHIVAKRA